MFDAKMTVPQAPLYRAEFEHDNCGIGACVNIKGLKSREIVENALKIVENLEHRAGKDAEGKTVYKWYKFDAYGVHGFKLTDGRFGS